MKKLMVLILCIGLLTTGLYGCGKQENVSETTGLASASTSADISENPETESTAGAWEEEPAEVTWYMWNVGGSFTEAGVQAVEDALNEITLKKINVKVDLVILEMGTYMTQMAMQVSAGDKIDLITTFPAGSGYYSTMVNTGQLLPLDSLIDDYAPELYDIIPEALLEATIFKGKLYAVPIYTDYVQSSCTVAKAAMFDETGMKPEDISSNEDLTEVFKKLHELHPEIILLSSGSKTLVGRRGFDTMGTQAAAVYFGEGGDPTKVVNLFEHEAYKAEVAQIREWYLAGYVDKDLMMRETDPSSESNVFAGFLAGNMARLLSSESLHGESVYKLNMQDSTLSTSMLTNITMAIPVSATEPEAAMKLMNLCYTDAEVKNLVSFGLEGMNYTVNADGSLHVEVANNSYAPNNKAIFGNVFLCKPLDIEAAIGYDMNKIDQSAARFSPLLGFSVDLDPITSEVAAISTVVSEYQAMIECGMCDDATYAQFLEKLEKAGIQKYIDEIQRQLDEWWAQKKG